LSKPSRLSRPFFILLLLLLLYGLWIFSRPAEEPSQPLVRSRLLMGTVVEITAFGSPPDALERAVTAAFAEMARIEELMSPHRTGSDVARLAEAETEPVAVASETAEVITLGLTVAARSGGAFDLCLGRLKDLWGIETDHPRVPTPEEIQAALEGTGQKKLQVIDNTIVKHDPRSAVDLGGIAKGFALERAARVMEEAGIRHAAVNAGGDIRLLGDKLGGPWRIGVQHPRDSGKILARLALQDVAVVTSGDYERFFMRDGHRYHHLFDPATGYPADRCQSVTVVAPRADLADALATAAFVLGPKKGLDFLKSYPEVEGMIVDAAGQLTATPGLKGRTQ